ncbi:transcription factor bHLH57-like isoform X2 [Telopea speciosissima]|uniref:transcription factor bHLH57-like isoform X2 n=1 Tax=Telopea speciosissima TaxID=54955 RepID=UPI001CC403DB|nr:transcription factor bHLH57-like isoform X2 [Telopea speciosissima]
MDPETLRCEEEGRQPFSTLIQHLDEKMSFVQMLRGVESSASIDPNFQFLLRLQQQQQQQNQKKPETYFRNQALELESCISNEISETQSPIKSEGKDPPHRQSSSCPEVEMEVVSSACKGQANSPEKCREGKSGSSSGWWNEQNRRRTKGKLPQSNKAGPAVSSQERRKRKRTRASKNKEMVESQRMNHIAVERNRRRQMNDHLNALRSLMPASFIQRDDQASIIGGATDFVKELEQVLQSLEAQKRLNNKSKGEGNRGQHSKESVIPLDGFLASPQYTTYSLTSTTMHSSVVGFSVDDDVKRVNEYMEEEEDGEKLKVEKKPEVGDIEVIVIQKRHVNLLKIKIVSARRKAGQLVRAIAALEDLRLNILQLNITSSQHSVLYSFNLKR